MIRGMIRKGVVELDALDHMPAVPVLPEHYLSTRGISDVRLDLSLDRAVGYVKKENLKHFTIHILDKVCHHLDRKTLSSFKSSFGERCSSGAETLIPFCSDDAVLIVKVGGTNQYPVSHLEWLRDQKRFIIEPTYRLIEQLRNNWKAGRFGRKKIEMEGNAPKLLLAWAKLRGDQFEEVLTALAENRPNHLAKEIRSLNKKGVASLIWTLTGTIPHARPEASAERVPVDTLQKRSEPVSASTPATVNDKVDSEAEGSESHAPVSAASGMARDKEQSVPDPVGSAKTPSKPCETSGMTKTCDKGTSGKTPVSSEIAARGLTKKTAEGTAGTSNDTEKVDISHHLADAPEGQSSNGLGVGPMDTAPLKNGANTDQVLKSDVREREKAFKVYDTQEHAREPYVANHGTPFSGPNLYMLMAAINILALGTLFWKMSDATTPTPTASRPVVELTAPTMEPDTDTLEGDPETEAAPTLTELSGIAFAGITSGDYDQARAAINVMRVHPDINPYWEGDAWNLDGKLLRKLGKFRQAAVSFERAKEAFARHPGNTDAHQMMASAESARMEVLGGFPEIALKNLEDCFNPTVKDHSATQVWYGAKGEAYLTMGDYKSYLSVSQERLALNPTETAVYSEIAFAHVLLGNLAEARVWASKRTLEQRHQTESQWAYEIVYNIAELRVEGLPYEAELKTLNSYLKKTPDYQLEHYLKIAKSFDPSTAY